MIVISNNPSVRVEGIELFKHEGDVVQVLEKVRDLIHLGHHLLTHPLAGSVKPNENPYKSVVVTGTPKAVDLQSVQIIEGCIQVARRMIKESPPRAYPEQVLADMALIDRSLLEAGLESLSRR